MIGTLADGNSTILTTVAVAVVIVTILCIIAIMYM